MADRLVGLKRGIVRLSRHKREWKKLFRRERERILPAIRKWVAEIHHEGSTAIPGIPAKPIIDMEAFVQSERDARRVLDALTELGYHDRGEGPGRNRWLAAKGPETGRTHYFHITSFERRDWYRALLFRDWLLQDRSCARRYGRLKARLAARYSDNRRLYTRGKSLFIRSVLRKASGTWPVRSFTRKYRVR